MAAERDQIGTQPAVDDALTEDLFRTNIVQERGGSFLVSIPKESAQDLGIGKGDRVLFLGKAGDEELRVQKTQSFLADQEHDR